MHGVARFQPVDNTTTMVMNRAGWRQGQGEQQEWLILPEVWKSEICAGLEPAMVAKALADRGMLAKASDGYQKNHRIEGRQMRLYTITARILAGLDDESGVAGVAGVASSFSEGAIKGKEPINLNVVTGATPATPKNPKETDIHIGPPREKPMADRGDATNNGRGHKCDHCGEFGDTLECGYGSARPWLHRECQDAWRAKYDKRTGGLDIPEFLDRRGELRQ
jgi:hypothetical protein